jgi:hypothetical protein
MLRVELLQRLCSKLRRKRRVKIRLEIFGMMRKSILLLRRPLMTDPNQNLKLDAILNL